MVPKWFQLAILGLPLLCFFMTKKRTKSAKSDGTASAKTPAPGQRIPTNREGVYYRESKKRKHNNTPDRTYCYMVWDHGKKRYVNVGRASQNETEDTAYKARIAALAKIHKDEQIDSFSDKKKHTFERIVTSYMEWKKAEGKHTAEDWSRYNKHLKAELGSMPIAQIAKKADSLKIKLLETLAPSSVKKIFILARAAINYSKRKGIFNGSNPFERQANFTMPCEDNKAERFLSKEEADNLLEELARRSQQLHDMAFISLYTGMRATEIFGLRGSDLDKNSGTVIVTAKGGKREAVDTLPQIFAVLLRYQTKPGTLLFQNRKGNRYRGTPDTFGRAVDSLGFNDSGNFTLNKKGKQVPVKISDARHRVRFHTLRHTFSSWLAQSGQVDIYELKELLRHRRIETTLRYVHLIPSEQRKKKMNVLVPLMQK